MTSTIFSMKTRMGLSSRDKISPAATNSNYPSYAPEIILPNRTLLPKPETIFSNPCIVTLTFDLLPQSPKGTYLTHGETACEVS